MKIVGWAELVKRVAIILRVQKASVRRAVGYGSGAAVDQLAEQIVSSALRGSVVVEPSFISSEKRAGMFGQDEPHPFPAADHAANAGPTREI